MMDLQELSIKHSYISYGEDGIAKALITPALKVAKMYKRSVGFFSSSALLVILDGVISLVKNTGKIQLIASPRLSHADIEAIKSGYSIRAKLVEECFSSQFQTVIEELDEDRLKMLCELISKGYLDIKIAITKGAGMYHDKLGIIEDMEGNTIAFYGSANASYDGYCENYEKVRVARSWIEGEKESVEDEELEFDNLWNNSNPFVEVYEYTDCAKKNLLKVVAHKANTIVLARL